MRPVTCLMSCILLIVTLCGWTDVGTADDGAAWRFHQRRTPAMIGDFFGGAPISFRGDRTLDSLVVLANDLDAPLALPPGGSTLSITEPGPVGIFSTSLASIQQLQTLARAGNPLPAATLVDIINQDATLTTVQSVAQLQSLLASTGAAYDIIALQAPPSTYSAGVQVAFVTRNGGGGQTVYNGAASGAVLQGGTDTLTGGEDFDAYYFFDYVVRFDTRLTDSASGGVGRTKLAEGGTVLPQDRWFVRTNYVDAVRYADAGGLSLNRFTPGFERAFVDGLASFELRAPLASGTVTNATYDGLTGFSNDRDVRFGNLSLYGKVLLIESEALAISGGLGVALPTAADIRVSDTAGQAVMEVANQTLRLQPFLGALLTPTQRLYAHGFVQMDCTASGNPVSIDASGQGLRRVGMLTDANQLYFDAGIGYWLYRDDSRSGRRGGLTGIVPTVELHHTMATQSGDVVTAGVYHVGNFAGTPNFTNLVAGSTFEFGQSSQLVIAYGAPLDGVNRQYNGALTVGFSHQLR